MVYVGNGLDWIIVAYDGDATGPANRADGAWCIDTVADLVLDDDANVCADVGHGHAEGAVNIARENVDRNGKTYVGRQGIEVVKMPRFLFPSLLWEPSFPL